MEQAIIEIDKWPGNPNSVCGAWLFLASRLRHGVQEAEKRDAERLAHALGAIALQVGQSLWRSRSSDPVDHHGAHNLPSATRL